MKNNQKYSSIRLTNYTSCNSYTAFILLRRKSIYYSFSFSWRQSHGWFAMIQSFYKLKLLASKVCCKPFSELWHGNAYFLASKCVSDALLCVKLFSRWALLPLWHCIVCCKHFSELWRGCACFLAQKCDCIALQCISNIFCGVMAKAPKLTVIKTTKVNAKFLIYNILHFLSFFYSFIYAVYHI